MTLVVDASVAVKWLVDEPDHLAARTLLERSEQLHAPDFVFVETANVLWKKVLRCELTAQQAVEGVELVTASVRNGDTVHPSRRARPEDRD